jgi:hypothetical protein
MKDAFGAKLKVGDVVVTVRPYFRGLVMGTVERETPTGRITVRSYKDEQALVRDPSEIYKVPPGPDEPL